MLSAYCETSVTRLSAKVPPSPATIARAPTPIGSPAAITLPKMARSRTRAMGSDTFSARCRSLSRVVLKAWLIGTFPVPLTVREPGCTSCRSAA